MSALLSGECTRLPVRLLDHAALNPGVLDIVRRSEQAQRLGRRRMHAGLVAAVTAHHAAALADCCSPAQSGLSSPV
jgi:hypothetical protein